MSTELATFAEFSGHLCGLKALFGDKELQYVLPYFDFPHLFCELLFRA